MPSMSSSALVRAAAWGRFFRSLAARPPPPGILRRSGGPPRPGTGGGCRRWRRPGRSRCRPAETGRWTAWDRPLRRGAPAPPPRRTTGPCRPGRSPGRRPLSARPARSGWDRCPGTRRAGAAGSSGATPGVCPAGAPGPAPARADRGHVETGAFRLRTGRQGLDQLHLVGNGGERVHVLPDVVEPGPATCRPDPGTARYRPL
jgi:hypothetical protein